MSYDCNLEIALVEGDCSEIGAKKPEILKQLADDGIHSDVYSDLKDAFTLGRANFRVHPFYLLQLLDSVATLLPAVAFDARGLGEAFRDTWIAEYRKGQRVFSQGPWDEA